jgi:hypothetical protein
MPTFDSPTGVNNDGSQHLLPESKWGHAVSIIFAGGALGIADALGGLDLGFLPSWAVAIAAAGVGTLAGLLTSWAKKNR